MRRTTEEEKPVVKAPAFKIEVELLETEPEVMWYAVLSKSHYRARYKDYQWTIWSGTGKRGHTRDEAIRLCLQAYHAAVLLDAQIKESMETLTFDEVPTEVPQREVTA